MPMISTSSCASEAFALLVDLPPETPDVPCPSGSRQLQGVFHRISGSKDAVQFCGTPHQLMILLVDAVPGTGHSHHRAPCFFQRLVDSVFSDSGLVAVTRPIPLALSSEIWTGHGQGLWAWAVRLDNKGKDEKMP